MKLIIKHGPAPLCEACGPDEKCSPNYWTLVFPKDVNEDGIPLKVGFEICDKWRGEEPTGAALNEEDGSYWEEGMEMWTHD